MDVLLLRTLAWKSKLGFGKYSDLSVMEVYNLNHTLYLRWVYFNCSMISFNNEILEAIYLFEDYRIEKPGVMPENHGLLNDQIHNKAHLFHKKRIKKLQKNSLKYAAFHVNRTVSKQNSKSNLTRKNHGH